METWIKTDNKWHHVVITMNEDNEKLTYMDGVLFSTERISVDSIKGVLFEKIFTQNEINDIYHRGVGK